MSMPNHTSQLCPAPEHEAFLAKIGAGHAEHGSRTLLEHLRGTWTILELWRAPHAWCLAGLFHSVYGTDRYRLRLLSEPRRSHVRNLIGHEAERLTWLFGTIDRERVIRVDGSVPGTTELARPELVALRNIHLANALEQEARDATTQADDWRAQASEGLLERAAECHSSLCQGIAAAHVLAELVHLGPVRDAIEARTHA